MPTASATPSDSSTDAAPLAGLTVLELGTYFAGPYGTAILADYGARVIKIEQLDGDPSRSHAPFPEVGGIKVLQGKESIAVDVQTAEGREILERLALRADAVLQTFRAGVADRLRCTAEDLRAINPDLVYLNAQGYGMGGPCGHRPAFASTIGPASGLALRTLGGRDVLAGLTSSDSREVKDTALRLTTAAIQVAHADGFSALAVGTALLLGLLAKRRHGLGQVMSTTMLQTMGHVLSEDMIEYADRPAVASPDAGLYGLSARYRLYPCSEGWIFLAAPKEKDWQALAEGLGLPRNLRRDDAELATVLSTVFAGDTAASWEKRLRALDVACAEVADGPVERAVMVGGTLGRDLGLVTDVEHPTIGTYPRLTPLTALSRTPGVAGSAPLLGQHTDSILRELGYTDSQIEQLRDKQVVS